MTTPQPPRSWAYDAAVITAIFAGGLNIGLFQGILGPTLTDLAQQTGVTLTTASTLSTARAVTFIAGSLVSGVLLQHVEGWVALTPVLFLQGITTALSGCFSNFLLTAIMQGVSNFFGTIMVTGLPLLVFQLERPKARVVAQIAFLLFNVGKTIVPFIAAPFLSADTQPSNTSTPAVPTGQTTIVVQPSVASGFNLSSESSSQLLQERNMAFAWRATMRPSQTKTRVGWAYVIVAVYCVLMSILYGVIALVGGCQWRANATHIHVQNKEEDDEQNKDAGSADSSRSPGEATPNGKRIRYAEATLKDGSHNEATERNRYVDATSMGRRQSEAAVKRKRFQSESIVGAVHSRGRMVLIIGLFLLAIFMQSGMETIEAGLLVSYVTKYLGLAKMTGLVMTSIYQGIKVVICLGLVFVVNRVHPATIVLVDVACMVAATSGMTVAVVAADQVGFYASIVILAIGMSNYYATTLSWVQLYYPITGWLSSMISIFFGLSGMGQPPLTTGLLEVEGAVAFPAVLLVSSVLCAILWAALKVAIKEEPLCPPLGLVEAVGNKDEAEVVVDERSALISSRRNTRDPILEDIEESQ